MSVNEAYQQLSSRMKDVVYVDHILSLMGWDEMTKLPEMGSEFRGITSSYLAGVRHNLFVSEETGELLEKAEWQSLGQPDDSPEKVNIREWKRSYDRLTKLPVELVKALTQATTEGRQAWIKAREADDFSVFETALEKIVSLSREKAEALGYEEEAYDALLEDYEPGTTTSEVAAIFDEFRPQLQTLLDKLKGKPIAIEKIPEIAAEPHKKLEFIEQAVAKVGYDFKRGRLDLTEHPFCESLGPNDVRITCRFTDDFLNDFLAGMHETGHALYELNFNQDHYGFPAGYAASMATHESQSLTVEHWIGQSKGFWKFITPSLHEAFPELKPYSSEQLHRYVNRLSIGPTRLTADVLTYHFHIFIRFALERQLIAGKMEVKDVPEMWKKLMNEYLGVDVKGDTEGSLQDIHWSVGLLGYFPTYSLGHIFAAQLYDAATLRLGNLEQQFEEGHFSSYINWLTNNIHILGQTYAPFKLIEKATGEPVSPSHLIKHLETVFGELYDL